MKLNITLEAMIILAFLTVLNEAALCGWTIQENRWNVMLTTNRLLHIVDVTAANTPMEQYQKLLFGISIPRASLTYVAKAKIKNQLNFK